jgi:hypothetical protein
MRRLEASLEKFETSNSHYYLRVNGKIVAALLPSDFIKIIEAVKATHNSRVFVKDAVEAYYTK